MATVTDKRMDHFQGSHYDAAHSTGPINALNPTTRYLPVNVSSKPEETAKTDGAVTKAHPDVAHVWRSRDNRKGRHALVVHPDRYEKQTVTGGDPTETSKQAMRGLLRMVVQYPLWDVSYDVAIVFTIGSAIWVINGFFAWLPVAYPSTEFAGETTWGGGITALVGATVFEFGSILLMLEAVNENTSDCFGWAVEEEIDGLLRVHQQSHHHCQHSHPHKRAWLRGQNPVSLPKSDEEGTSDNSPTRKATTIKAEGKLRTPSKRMWSWWPTWHELSTHYVREIGFWASLSQMAAATIFWVSGFTALPPILNSRLTSIGAQQGAYWTPQVVGGLGFVVSSTLFMIEVQPRWYIPAPKTLGWHIGAWNLVGSLGFTLCGALGLASSQGEAIEYALTLSTFIGSWAFLIGSCIQWYESLDKYPIWKDKNVRNYTKVDA